MHRRPPAAAALLLAVLLLLLAACGGEEDLASASTTAAEPAEPAAPGGAVTTAAPVDGEEEARGRVIELVYEGGQVTIGGGRIELEAGEVVTLEVTSDVDEEVHVHGYDIVVGLVAGEVTTIEVVGDLPGVWEVELHESGVTLAELAVAG